MEHIYVAALFCWTFCSGSSTLLQVIEDRCLLQGVLTSIRRPAVLCSVEFNTAEPAYVQYTYLDQVPFPCLKENHHGRGSNLI